MDFSLEDDLRRIVHELSKGSYAIGKCIRLQTNYRSHKGVLDVAVKVLDALFREFKGSADKLPKDEGVFRGPRPVYIASSIEISSRNSRSYELVQKILLSNEKIVVICLDEHIERVRDILKVKNTIFGIRMAKVI